MAPSVRGALDVSNGSASACGQELELERQTEYFVEPDEALLPRAATTGSSGEASGQFRWR